MESRQSRKSVVLFCQAYTAVQHCVDICGKNEDKRVIIYTYEKQIADFLGLLNLPAEVRLIELRKPGRGGTLGTVIGISKNLSKIKTELKAAKELFKGSTVYFFSNYFDYATFFFLNKLRRQSRIIFLDIFDLQRPEKRSIGLWSRGRKRLFEILTGGRLAVTGTGDKEVLTYPYEHYGLEREKAGESVTIPERYLYRGKTGPVSAKRALLFESNEELGGRFSNYEQEMVGVLEVVSQNGFEVHLKPHPRLGCSSFLTRFSTVIPERIPSEFLDYAAFSLVLGVDTAALVFPAQTGHPAVVSILRLLTAVDEKVREDSSAYLANLSPNIRIVGDLEELASLVAKC
jgi:hypothetical protein